VRLRHAEERVLPYYEITRKEIAWKPGQGFRQAPAAHFTFNPSLIRRTDIPKIYPCSSEHHAQIRFLEAGLGTAQLEPGIFRHIGGGKSRKRLLAKIST
jgi:hypothetical protein